ncbi:MAG: hypothetical protein IPJ07_20400 [Acidobacteria bacterium]|nr:hypothetical protein [Acidobacteriota bacterium]
MRLLNYLGLQYFNNERYDEARQRYLLQALTISHKYPTGRFNRGSTLNRQWATANQAVAVLNYLQRIS